MALFEFDASIFPLTPPVTAGPRAAAPWWRYPEDMGDINNQ